MNLSSDSKLKKRLKRAEDLSIIAGALPDPKKDEKDEGEFPEWVDEMGVFLWEHGSQGSLGEAIIVYGLKDRRGGELEGLTRQEIDALDTCDRGNSFWTAWLCRFGEPQVKRMYANRGRYDSEGWKEWEALAGAFRELWLYGESTWGDVFEMFNREDMVTYYPESARYHRELEKQSKNRRN